MRMMYSCASKPDTIKKRERIKGMEVLTFKALPRGASLVFPFAMTTNCDTNQPHAQHLLRG